MEHEKCMVIIISSLILISGCITQREEQNPVTNYTKEKEFSPEVYNSLKVLGEDKKLNEHEKKFIDTISELPQQLQYTIINSSFLADGTITRHEFTFLSIAIEMEDLTLAVFESNIAQYEIDAELVERLETMKQLAESSKENKMMVKIGILEKYYPPPEPLEIPVEKAMELHKGAWEMVLNNAKEDQYYKYGIFVSRTLAVKHPEVYLQSDGIFEAIITTNRGFKEVYNIKDVHTITYFMERTFESPPFSFDFVDFSGYNLVKSEEYYPEGYPVLPFFDRRLLPIASTLKSAETQLTQLELGVQYYFATKTENEVYLIYCDNQNTYVATGQDIIWMKTLDPITKIEGNPILIFNEEYVWYPLMERDDTDKSKILKRLVTTYKTDINTPSLSEFEQKMIDTLQQVTALSSDLEKSMAQVLSMRPVQLDEYIKYVRFSDTKAAYAVTYDRVVKNNVNIYAERRSFLKHGNFLSPITAYLAAIGEEYPGNTKLMEISREYLKHSSAHEIWLKAHGHTWDCMLVEQTIDESYTTKAGHCIVQAANLSAVLDLGGIDNYWIEGLTNKWGLPGHDWLCILGYGAIISNGVWSPKGPLYTNIIDFIGFKEKWAYIEGEWTGTASPEELIEMLNGLDEFYEEEILIYRGINLTERTVNAISLEEFIRILEEQ
ncbi:MAG: hypothetical protein PVF58_01510 [Candidatus Methanofastidiosia archaeon]|jgi:hypothetical protein